MTIARPADEVLAFLADLRHIMEWTYAIARTVQTWPGPAGVGASYRQTRTIPRRSEESLQITVFEPLSRLTVQGQIGPFQAATSYLLEPAAGGTRLTNEVELETSSALLRLIGPLARGRVRAADVGQRRLCMAEAKVTMKSSWAMVSSARGPRAVRTAAMAASGEIPAATR